MIPLSPAAEWQLRQLTRFYAARGRDAAIDRLADCVERAGARIAAGRGPFHDAPRPYPTLRPAGWRWTKEGSYWIAFPTGPVGPVILAIFHEAADIPRRL